MTSNFEGPVDEGRRALLVKADRIRQIFTKLPSEIRTANEAEIVAYVENLRRWGNGRGLYPAVPNFLSKLPTNLKETIDCFPLNSKPARIRNAKEQLSKANNSPAIQKIKADLEKIIVQANNQKQAKLVEILNLAMNEIVDLSRIYD